MGYTVVVTSSRILELEIIGLKMDDRSEKRNESERVKLLHRGLRISSIQEFELLIGIRHFGQKQTTTVCHILPHFYLTGTYRKFSKPTNETVLYHKNL